MQCMHILTFDIEEWYIEKVCNGGRKERYDLFDRTLENLLAFLESNDIKATFFCLGQMAIHFPQVVQRLATAGHDIGCHSNIHTWLNKMTPEECREDTHVAVDTLEQCIGKKVRSYRAPAFSIGKNNPWAFEILAENGIEMDASVFPAERDFGGFPDFGAALPSIITYNGITIKEFPVCTTKLLGHDIVYSGGGYFRFFPEVYISRKLNASDYAMMYFHISDLAALKIKFLTKEEYENYYKESGTFYARAKRHFKDNFAFGDTFAKFKSIVGKTSFVNLETADTQIDWQQAPRISL